MNTKRFLAPRFINRLDRHLLLNKPEVWSARTHLVIFYSILFMTLLAAIAFIVPNDPRTQSPAPYWIGFVSIISLISLVLWAMYLLRFNVFKRFGISGPIDRLKTFLLYFIAIGCIVLFSYVEPFVETIRANAAYSDEEVVDDINKINMGICQLEYDSLNHKWHRDTVHVVEKADEVDAPVAYPDDYTTTTTVDTVQGSAVNHIYLSRRQLNERLQTADSVQKINDTLYVLYVSPVYTFLQPYQIHRNAAVQPFDSKDVYERLIKNYTPPANKATIRKEVEDLIAKYNLYWREDYYAYRHEQLPYFEVVQRRYFLHGVGNSMDNILERKHRWSANNLQSFVRIFMYVTLLLTLLTFAFRHSTVRTFFLSLLAGIVLSIFTTLIMAFTGGSGSGFYEWMIFYFVVFFVLSLLAFKSKKRNLVTGIGLNLFLWLLPFIPLIIVANYYEDLRRRTHYFDYPDIYKHLVWAEVGGLVLLLVLIPTYIHKAYRRWYAAAEE